MSAGQLPPPWPHPAYRIETDRLVIRCYAPTDAAELCRVVQSSRGHLARWMPWAENPDRNAEGDMELIRTFRGNFDLGRDFIYGIYDAATDQQIGGTGLHPRQGPGALEIGYWIAVDRVRQGLATEASAALTQVGFEVMRAKRMEIRCDPANVASAGVPAKLGYTLDGVIRASLPQADGSLRDTAVYTMPIADYPGTPASTARVRALGARGQLLLESS